MSSLVIPPPPPSFLQFSLKTSGLYKATISDDRGKDMSQIDISGKGKQTELLMKLIDEGKNQEYITK